ncbi:fungal-specific transcription factor domain-containing protein [Calycina marina]|uniref:Fungal-specific transcription factor domain-containing protein n=1 Tax=Calycina marina TaxID=1763456 RepID=A0A9P7YZL2_9HELO|nr:fungal-specific transcription factor domain-containing protein [Calycina marina]
MAHNFMAGIPPPPPQIFGAYDQLMQPSQADMSAQMFGDASMGMGMDESIEAKRRRIARACDECRRKKIKCDGQAPSCGHCTNTRTACLFTQVEKKKNPPKGAKYIEALENRVGRMETILELAGLLNDNSSLEELERSLKEGRRASVVPASSATSPEQSQSYHDTPNNMDNGSTPHSPLASPELQPSSQHEKIEGKVEDLSEAMSSLVTNNCGEIRFIGSSSGFSIFSSLGMKWVHEKTGDKAFEETITASSVDNNKWMYWKPEVFTDIFTRTVYTPIPGRDEAVSLLKDFFENFNCMFPLFHQPTFMHLVDRWYTKDRYNGSGWWASFNVALAIAHRLRVMSNLVSVEEDEKAWGYLKNALGVFTELTLRNTDLLSVQALLGMALFLQGTPNPQPNFALVAAAIRASHSIGLHKRGTGFKLNPVEIEQRKRVFWIGYMVDKDMCLRSGRPTVGDDDDMNVELPSADPDDGIGNIPLADGKSKINIFRVMCEFATIESKVNKQLYSTKAAKQSAGELLSTIGELDTLLETWKDSIPLDFRPDHPIKASHTPLILHIVVLHFAYFNCLTTIHRMSVQHGYWTSRLSEFAIQGLNTRRLNPRVFASANLCVHAARASIGLIHYLPQGDSPCVWLVLYFPVSALVTLFSNILQNPSEIQNRSDVGLMGLVVKFMEELINDQGNGSIQRTLGVCREFERIANAVLDKTDKDSSARRKRKAVVDEKTKSKHSSSMMSNSGNGVGQRNNSQGLPNGFSPAVNHNSPSFQQQQQPQNSYTPVSAGASPQKWQQDVPGGEHQDALSPWPDLFGDNGGSDITSPISQAQLFQQPFVPADLFQDPMSLQWDWNEITSGAYPSFENGVVADPGLFSESLHGGSVNSADMNGRNINNDYGNGDNMYGGGNRNAAYSNIGNSGGMDGGHGNSHEMNGGYCQQQY